MKLTNTQCKNAQPKTKVHKLADGGGLYLLVKPNGAKHWRLKYRFLGKEKLLALGPYPLVSLAEARERRDEAKKVLADGKDPINQKQDKKRQAVRNAQNTFKAVALEWHGNQKDAWSEHHALNVMRRLEIDIFPYIGNKPIADIDAQSLLYDVIKRVEDRKAFDVASRVKQICGQVFRYGIITRKCTRDVSADLKGAMKSYKKGHYHCLEIKEMHEFLATLEENKPRLYERTKRGIRLLMLTFVRTSELIEAKWSEFDLDNGLWEIPAERMKMGKPHIVPLSKQVIKLLKQQKEETGDLETDWVLPSQIRLREHMSNNTILFAIGRLGYKGRMTGHGFRALAMSTIKEKLGYRHEVVDRQLAHAHKSKIDRAYDRAQFLDERKKMMQEWADYMDRVEKTGDVSPVKRRKAVA